jgi:hypothetical protein
VAISKERFDKAIATLEYLTKKPTLTSQEAFDLQQNTNITLIYHIQELSKRVQELENTRHLSLAG